PTARPSKEQQSTTQLVVTVDEHATVDGVAMRGAIPDMPKIFAAMLLGFFDFTYCSNCGVSRVTVRCSTELCRRTPSYEKKKNRWSLTMGPPTLPANWRNFCSLRSGHCDATSMNVVVPLVHVSGLAPAAGVGP